MKQYICGSKLFVADLAIVSVWAFFAWREVGWGFCMSTLILIRIALAFELYRKSRWASLSSLMFGLAWLGCFFSPMAKYVDEPVWKMAYVLLCLAGRSDLAIATFTFPDDTHQWAVWTFWGLFSAWLVLLPLFFSFRLKGCAGILRRCRRLWWYPASVVAVSLLSLINMAEFTLFIFAVLMALVPLVYHVFCRRRRRPLLQEMLRDRVLVAYLSVMALFYVALLLGLYDIRHAVRPAAFIFPVILYVVAGRSSGVPLHTVPALLCGTGGFFLVNCYHRFHTVAVTWLCVGIAVALAGVIIAFRRSGRIWPGVLLFVADAFVMPVILLGYNPYAVINGDYVDLMKASCRNAPEGLYGYSENGLLGVRDRYGVVVCPEYYNMDFLDDAYQFMWFAIGERNSEDYRLQVFDLIGRKPLIPANGPEVTEIRKSGCLEYALLDKGGKRIYTLRLEPVVRFHVAHEVYLGRRRFTPRLPVCGLSRRGGLRRHLCGGGNRGGLWRVDRGYGDV